MPAKLFVPDFGVHPSGPSATMRADPGMEGVILIAVLLVCVCIVLPIVAFVRTNRIHALERRLAGVEAALHRLIRQQEQMAAPAVEAPAVATAPPPLAGAGPPLQTPPAASGPRPRDIVLLKATPPLKGEKKAPAPQVRKPCAATWDRRFRLSTLQSQRLFSASHGRGSVSEPRASARGFRQYQITWSSDPRGP